MSNHSGQYKGVIFVICSVVLSACAQLFMKSGMLELANSGGLQIAHFGMDRFFEPAFMAALLWVCVGLVSYAVSMLFWMAALARYELSLAYPMLSLSYVLVYIGAVLWPRFNESVTMLRTAGIVLIVIGVILVTQSKNESASSASTPGRT
ncbi:4-amino-4-deoxy-L-arabinose-phosphoundecaprenol flippase subunit ArnF [Kaarinaea lacus]